MLTSPVSPSFSLEATRMRLESSQHKILIRELMRHVYLMYLEAGLKYALGRVRRKADVTVKKIYATAGRNSLSLSTLLFCYLSLCYQALGYKVFFVLTDHIREVCSCRQWNIVHDSPKVTPVSLPKVRVHLTQLFFPSEKVIVRHVL